MYEFIMSLFGVGTHYITTTECKEYEKYREKYKDNVYLSKSGDFYYIYRVDGKPLCPVGRMVFEDSRIYTEEANAQAYFIEYCKYNFEQEKHCG